MSRIEESFKILRSIEKNEPQPTCLNSLTESEHKIKVLRDALELIAKYPNVNNIVGHWADKALKDTE